MAWLDAIFTAQDWITFYAVQPLLILFIGVFVGKVLEQTLLFAFHEFKADAQRSIIVATIVKWVVYIASVGIALSRVDVLHLVLWFFAGVVVALLLLRFALSIVDFFPNFFSYHAVKAKFKPGAVVKTKITDGRVVRVHLSETHIRTEAGDNVYVPNSTLRKLTTKA